MPEAPLTVKQHCSLVYGRACMAATSEYGATRSCRRYSTALCPSRRLPFLLPRLQQYRLLHRPSHRWWSQHSPQQPHLKAKAARATPSPRALALLGLRSNDTGETKTAFGRYSTFLSHPYHSPPLFAHPTQKSPSSREWSDRRQ